MKSRTIQTSKTTVTICPNYPRGFGISGNFGFGELNRRDRQGLGLTYAEIELGRVRIMIHRQNRFYVERILTVAERGVW